MIERLNHTHLKGNWATLLLTTDKQGKIDYSRMNDEIDLLIASSPNGIYSNGTAGEFYSLTEDEFMRISELLASKCHRSGVHFQLGVSHMSPQLSLQRLQSIRALTPSAVQVILPDWFPVTLEEAANFLQTMDDAAAGIPLVLYNPPHAKRVLSPEDWHYLKQKVDHLIGVKVFDCNGDPAWYSRMRAHKTGLSVFIPGHRLATGIGQGADGSYSNMACLNPFAAQKWYQMTIEDNEAALELEKRIGRFMDIAINPFITRFHYPNHACDRFMAMVGGWTDVGAYLRWPYRSIPLDRIESTREQVKNIIPEFFIPPHKPAVYP